MYRLTSVFFLLLALAFPHYGQEKKPRFVDVTAESGLQIVKGSMPHAVAVADFDGDGRPDILLAAFDKPHVQLFRNLGNMRFQDVTKGSGLEAFQGAGSGIAVGDYDGDGHLDLYITSVRGGPSRLFRGKGNMTFEDVSAKSGTLLDAAARSCAWSDVDGDGWLDLFVCCPEGGNRLFLNQRDGTFRDIAAEAGVALKGRHSLGCAFADVDGDGLDDLFVTNYKSQPSALFKNLGGGKFRDVTAASGLDRKASAVGCVFADVFNRGRFDLLVTTDSWLSGANYTEPQLLEQKHTVEPNLLYANDGKGVFRPVDAPELRFKSLSHDAVMEDLDHDGLVEIYVGVDAESGNKWATSKGGNPLWTRKGDGRWQEVSKAWGVHHEANCVCTAAADFDGDGDLDLLLVNFYSNVVLLRNTTDDNRWLQVNVQGTKGNRHGIGSRLALYAVRDGQRTLLGTRQIQSASGYCHGGPLTAHFGLGAAPADRYELETVFPRSRKPVVTPIAKGGRVVTVVEPKP
jgi:enediyne biosynthesis protein E4